MNVGSSKADYRDYCGTSALRGSSGDTLQALEQSLVAESARVLERSVVRVHLFLVDVRLELTLFSLYRILLALQND